MIVVGGCQLLAGCAARPDAPVITAPATVVQAPNPAVLHRVWAAGYAAGYDAAEKRTVRRDEQQQDKLADVPAAVSDPAPATASVPTPVAAIPPIYGFQSTGPATPINAGN
jgi:hypothetical protein